MIDRSRTSSFLVRLADRAAADRGASWALLLLAAAWTACGQAACPSGSVEVDGQCQEMGTDMQADPAGGDAGQSEPDGGERTLDASEPDGTRDGSEEAGDAASVDGGSEPTDLCDALACSPHARCVLDGSTGRCQCNQGYEGNGETCARNPCVAIVDGPAACGEHQSCAPLGEVEVECSCEAGFADCDKDAANGCETDTSSESQHCGSCGFACAEGLACTGGTCAQRVTSIDLRPVGPGGCALTPTRETRCWGKTEFSDYVEPAVASKIDAELEQLELGTLAHCGRSGEHLLCWGQNTYHALGSSNVDDTFHNFVIKGLEDMSLGHHYHGCAVAHANAYCWGYGNSGALGDGRTYPDAEPSRPFDESRPVKAAIGFEAVTGAVRVAVGRHKACVLLKSGGVQCWGGEWSDEDLKFEPYLAESVLADAGEPAQGVLGNATGLCHGGDFACATRDDKSLVCWGKDPAWTGSQQPPRNRYRTVAIGGVVEVACGEQHVCARTEAGEAYCWGTNHDGRLGIGTTEDLRTSPTRVVDLSDVVGIYAGFAQSCARVRSGRVYCWGDNQYGALGIGTAGGEFDSPQELVTWP